MPAMPRPGFVVVEAELVLGGLEAVFDRPAKAFNGGEGLDARAGRASCREEGEIAVTDMRRISRPRVQSPDWASSYSSALG
jgi:hypothetical protein